jgi:histidine triad (HIT) family protein
MDCIFCRIIDWEIPASRLYEDEQAVAFADIAPHAPVHFLVVPKKHLVSLAHVANNDAPLLGHLLSVTAELAAKQGLGKGFRTVINSGDDGGQTVAHLHIHVLGGRQMHWPPG